MRKQLLSLFFWNPRYLISTRLNSEHFTGFEKEIFSAMVSIQSIGGDVNEETVADKLGCSVPDLFPYKSTDHVVGNPFYLESQILEQHRRAKVKKVANEIVKSHLPSQELINRFHEATSGDFDTEVEPTKMSKCVIDSMHAFEDRYQCKVKKGLTTGIKKLDSYMGGFQDRRLYYIGARPSGGKSALLLNFMLNTGVKCLLFSAESGKQEVADRAIIRQGRIDSRQFMNGTVAQEGLSKIQDSASQIFEKNLIIYDKANVNITKLCSLAHEMKRVEGIEAIFIDYIQILEHVSSSDPHHLQVADTSKRLKQLARELNIPVICAAQLRRDADSNKPKLSDFSDSTQIERDADVAIFIYTFTKDEDSASETFLCIEKNRDGMTGDIRVTYEPQYFSFRD